MSKGIYILLFEGSDSVYIGQSIHIEKRYLEHCSNLQFGRANVKLTEQYKKYGLPKYEVLYTKESDECLDSLEEEFINEFDSVNTGCNVSRNTSFHGVSNPGELSGRAKLCNIQYVSIMMELISGTSVKDTAQKLNTNVSIVRELAIGRAHKAWLSKEYPEEYGKLMDLRGTRHGKFANKNTPKVISPELTQYDVGANVSKFAKEHSLDISSMCKLVTGKIKSHKGWKLLPNPT